MKLAWSKMLGTFTGEIASVERTSDGVRLHLDLGKYGRKPLDLTATEAELLQKSLALMLEGKTVRGS